MRQNVEQHIVDFDSYMEETYNWHVKCEWIASCWYILPYIEMNKIKKMALALNGMIIDLLFSLLLIYGYCVT